MKRWTNLAAWIIAVVAVAVPLRSVAGGTKPRKLEGCPDIGPACLGTNCYKLGLLRQRSWCLAGPDPDYCCSGYCQAWRCLSTSPGGCTSPSYEWHQTNYCTPYTCGHTTFSPCTVNDDLCCLPDGTLVRKLKEPNSARK